MLVEENLNIYNKLTTETSFLGRRLVKSYNVRWVRGCQHALLVLDIWIYGNDRLCLIVESVLFTYCRSENMLMFFDFLVKSGKLWHYFNFYNRFIFGN